MSSHISPAGFTFIPLFHARRIERLRQYGMLITSKLFTH